MKLFYEDNKEAIDNRVKELFPMLTRGLEINGLEQFMKDINSVFDRFNKVAMEDENVTCKSGCSNCCHDRVPLSLIESEYFKQYVKPKAVNPLKLQVQKNNVFSTLDFHDQRCSLLDKTGNCSIYEDRPLICRMHNSLEDPAKCRTQNGVYQDHKQAFSIDIIAIQFVLLLLSKEKTIDLHKIL